MSVLLIEQTLDEAIEVLTRFRAQPEQLQAIEAAAELLVHAFANQGKVISCGNGGSHCDAMHFAEELTGRFRDNRPALPALAISDPSHLTCVGNDYGFDQIFARSVEALGQAQDVLLAISTSGQSANILNAAHVAKEKGMAIITLTGKDGGPLAQLATVDIRVPHFGYADRIQEVHIKVIHLLIQLVEQKYLPQSD